MKLILLSLIFASSAFAQTPDWRPINRVYKSDGQTIGSVGSAGQIAAGHKLTQKSFTTAAWDSAKLSVFNLDGNGTALFGGRDLTLNGGAAGAVGIAGDSNGAIGLVSASSQYLSSTSSFFDPGHQNWSMGGWFYSADWLPAAPQTLINQGSEPSDKVFALSVLSDGSLEIAASSGGASWNIISNFAHGTPDATAGWHHIAMRYRSSTRTFDIFYDGKILGSSTMSSNLRNGTDPDSFYVGTYGASSLFFNGRVDEFFTAVGVDLADQDIRRIYSTRLDHNKALTAKRQSWSFKHQHLGTAGLPYQALPFVWHDPTDSNSLFVDFSDLDATDKIDIRLYDLQQ